MLAVESNISTPTDKYKKTPIPTTLRNIVWDGNIGRKVGEALCFCCEKNTILQRSFHCGHIVAEVKGGKTSYDNLLPICKSCNSSIGTRNMKEFKERYNLGNFVSPAPLQDSVTRIPTDTHTKDSLRIGFKNGTLNAYTNIFTVRSLNDVYSAYMGGKEDPIDYIPYDPENPTEEHKGILTFLDKIYPNLYLRDYVLRTLGELLHRYKRDNNSIAIQGNENSGKIQILKLLRTTLGDYVGDTPVSYIKYRSEGIINTDGCYIIDTGDNIFITEEVTYTIDAYIPHSEEIELSFLQKIEESIIKWRSAFAGLLLHYNTISVLTPKDIREKTIEYRDSLNENKKYLSFITNNVEPSECDTEFRDICREFFRWNSHFIDSRKIESKTVQDKLFYLMKGSFPLVSTNDKLFLCVFKCSLC